MSRTKSNRKDVRIATAVVRPSVGPPYTRCGTCRKQIFATVSRSTDLKRTSLLLDALVRRHIRDEHGEGK